MGVDENDLIPRIHHAASLLKTVAGFKFQEKGGWELRVTGSAFRVRSERTVRVGGFVRFGARSVRGPRGVVWPCSHASDHTRYALSTRSMLIADRGGLRDLRWSSAKLGINMLVTLYCQTHRSRPHPCPVRAPRKHNGSRDLTLPAAHPHHPALREFL